MIASHGTSLVWKVNGQNGDMKKMGNGKMMVMT